METLAEFQTRALSEVHSPDFRESLARLFGQFSLRDARALVQATNRLRGGPRAAIEKGATGAAIVAAAMRHYFGHHDGRGFFDFQYDYWGDRDPDARFPMRIMDIIFIMPTSRSTLRSVAFQVEAKNYSQVSLATLTSGPVATQIQKDNRYLNPRIRGHAPLVPVWWFLQGLDANARSYIEVQGFRVVDFMSDPFRSQLSRAFEVPSVLRTT
jgi:hypothetical protein